MLSENGSFRTLTQAGFHGSRWWAGCLARCRVASEDGAGSCSSVLGAAETGGARFSTAGVCPKMNPLPTSWQGDLSRQREAGLLLTRTHPSSLVTLGTTGGRSLHSSLLLRRLMRWSKLGLGCTPFSPTAGGSRTSLRAGPGQDRAPATGSACTPALPVAELPLQP